MEKKKKRRRDTIDITQEHKKNRTEITKRVNSAPKEKTQKFKRNGKVSILEISSLIQHASRIQKGASTNDGTVTEILETAPTILPFEKRAKCYSLIISITFFGSIPRTLPSASPRKEHFLSLILIVYFLSRLRSIGSLFRISVLNTILVSNRKDIVDWLYGNENTGWESRFLRNKKRNLMHAFNGVQVIFKQRNEFKHREQWEMLAIEGADKWIQWGSNQLA
ncbi:hypothetical protein PIB30_018311 [Stylosanthes scabra]|uniref:Uncharacterized protein n=1 Tax=Stylosanthes scabra TaxID=79078 RepID=A0ABU6Z5B5_9FABA|nr:hypothetical protein [Stylosanthes scabra]